MAERTVPTICRVCPAHCGVLATVSNGKLVRVTGDRDNPLYQGYSCVKGRALPDQHNNPARLLQSLKKGPHGVHQTIKSRTAIDEISERVTDIIEQHGPNSVALYVGTNALPYAVSPGLAHAWLCGIGSSMFFTSNTIDQPGKQIAAALHGGWRAGEQTFESSDTWLLVGLNPVISKSAGVPNHNPARYLKEARERGMKLVVVDPRKTETARFAHIHLQPRPGEDPTILAGFLHLILHEELHDQAFIEEHAEGLEALREAVRDFTPNYVAKRADIPVETFIDAVHTFALARRGCVSSGTGPSFATRGNLTEYLSLVLNTVCGRWTRPRRTRIET